MRRPVRRRALLGATASGVAAMMAGCLGGGPDCDAALPPPVRGDPQAAVTVFAFEDYACPHCREYVLEHLPAIVEEYVEPGRIRYEHHDFPLPVADPESFEAAHAARAVQETVGTEAFWTYSRRLYEEQSRLGPDLYADLATEVGADPSTVGDAAENRTYEDTTQCDVTEGEERGVQGTPVVFVDGEAVASYQSAAVSDAIDTALEFAEPGGG